MSLVFIFQELLCLNCLKGGGNKKSLFSKETPSNSSNQQAVTYERASPISPRQHPGPLYLLDFGLHSGGTGGQLVESAGDLRGFHSSQGIADGLDRLDHPVGLQREIPLREATL